MNLWGHISVPSVPRGLPLSTSSLSTFSCTKARHLYVLSPNVADSSPTRRENRIMSPSVITTQRSQRISLSNARSAPENIGTIDLCWDMRKKSIKLCGLCRSCRSHQFLCGSKVRIFFTFPVTLSWTLCVFCGETFTTKNGCGCSQLACGS